MGDPVKVPGERVAAGVGRLALGVLGLVAAVAVAILWGWWMALLAGHHGEGVVGALEICVVVAMGAMAVAVLGGAVWSLLQAPQVRRRYGRR